MKFKSLVLSLLAVTVLSVANLGAGINCIGILYQPKFPSKN